MKNIRHHKESKTEKLLMSKRIATEAEERIFGIACENTRRNAEYKTYTNRIIALGRQIMEHLGPHRRLFLEYERMIGLSEGVYMKNVYHIGLKDGKALPQFIK